jgi:putative CocE/NonD family hydrolase
MLDRGLFAQADAYVYFGASLAATHIARPVSCNRRSAATGRVERMAGSRAKLVLAALMAVVLLPAQAGAAVRYPGNGSWQPGAPAFGEGVLKDRAVVTDDGVRLSADVHYPADRATGAPATGPFPVLLALEPYAKDSPALAGAIQPTADFVPYGYIYVVVDVRGTGASGGSFDLFGPREQRDALEAIDWAAARPHSNGRVGMIGASYPALSALMAAGNEHPGSPLKAVFPIVAPSDVYRDLLYPGAIFNADFGLPYLLGLEVGLDTAAPLLAGLDPRRLVDTLATHLAGSLATDVSLLVEQALGGERRYDGPYWEQRRPATQAGRIAANGVATFVYNAWFDIWQRGDARVYNELQNGAAGRRPDAAMTPGQRADPRFQTAIGPYTHSGTPSGGLVKINGIGTPPRPGIAVDELAREWFDTWLKGADTGMAETPTPLHAFEVLGGRWVDLSTWPPPHARVRTYYFAQGRTGSALSLNDGALRPRPPHARGHDVLPWLPVTSPCSRMTDQELLQGPVKGYGDNAGLPDDACFFDDRTLQPQGLTYTTAPLRSALDVAGPIGATIYARATTRETEWVVTLDDVSPDGASRPLSTGDLLGSARATDPSLSWTLDGKVIAPGHPYTRASREPVTPGALTRYDIEIPPILARIAGGHRLRITINSSSTPYLLPSAGDVARLAGGIYEIQLGGRHASSVNVPLVDPRSLPSSAVDWGSCTTDC